VVQGGGTGYKTAVTDINMNVAKETVRHVNNAGGLHYMRIHIPYQKPPNAGVRYH